jgi:hypothetical protein
VSSHRINQRGLCMHVCTSIAVYESQKEVAANLGLILCIHKGSFVLHRADTSPYVPVYATGDQERMRSFLTGIEYVNQVVRAKEERLRDLIDQEKM